EDIRSFDAAMKKVTDHIQENWAEDARHVFVGHAFVTAQGKPEENTSDSELSLSVGGAEHVSNEYFKDFTYTALGHLHRGHKVELDSIRYSGSPLKFSISGEYHEKGYYVVEIKGGKVTTTKRILNPRRDMYTITASMDEILEMEETEDYVFVELTDRVPVLSPMEKVRSIFPNAMHVKRKYLPQSERDKAKQSKSQKQMTDNELFEAFHKEITGNEAETEMTELFKEIMDEQQS